MRLILPMVAVVAMVLTACGSSAAPDKTARPRVSALVANAAPPVPVGPNPVSVAVDEDAVWVLDQARGRLSRHEVASGRRQGAPVRVGRSPLALAAGEGAVWVLDAGSGVQRVDPATGRPMGRPVAVADPSGIAVGAGAVWVTSRSARSVTRIDAATSRPDAPIKLGVAPADIVVADGGVWVAATDAGSVVRIDPATLKPSAPLRLGRGQVLALAAGKGAIYAAVAKSELNDELELLTIDAKAAELTGDAIAITGGIPLRLAVGDGSVWATDIGSSLPGSPDRAPGLLRIDLAAGSAKTVTQIAGRPSAVATGPGAVWVTDSTRGTLTRVDLRR
jgi:streptogramin lyase